MARTSNKLTVLGVQRTKETGYHGDGGGLYLRVKSSGAKSWAFRFMIAGKAREMGLGSFDTMSLPEARAAAADARKVIAGGVDPIEAREAQEAANAAAKIAAVKLTTFKDAAQAYIAAHGSSWRNPKHRQQWANTLASYAYPVFGDFPVNEVDTGLVLKVLEPLWNSKTETASRVRGRIEAVLDWAAARGYRSGENPCRWRGHMANLLPAKTKVRRVVHQPSLPYPQMGDFMAALRRLTSASAKALEFVILTATRSTEARAAQWVEIDLDAALWTIPAERTKGMKEHRVPLSAAAINVLKTMAEIRQSEFVFPGGRKGSPLSDMALLEVCRGLGFKDAGDRVVVPHGFRSSFRTWGGEMTGYAHEVLELALAHAVGDGVVRAYARGDLFEKRTRLMQDWADFCAEPSITKGQVVPIRQQSA